MTRQMKNNLIERLERVIDRYGEYIEAHELNGDHMAAVPLYEKMYECRNLWFKLMDVETID